MSPERMACGGLTIHVHEAEKLSLEQIESFLNASQEIRFEGETQKQIYHWIEQVLGRQEYHQQSRQARGLLRTYLAKMTGLSRAQVTRLIARYRKSGSLQPAPYRRHRFPQRYTRADLELLATVDEAHENLSGPATRRILEREYRQYGKPEYKRLSTISVAHLYNLRQRPRYRGRRLSYTRTRPTAVAIGERRCPDPQGQPGYLRVDTRAPGRCARPQRRLPHQRGGSGHAMGDRVRHRAHQRSLAGTRAVRPDTAVSLPHSRLPFR